MDQLNSNSDAIAVLLEEAKAHAAEGEEFERLARQSYVAARVAILKAKTLALPGKLSNRAVAERIGRSPNWVDKLMDEKWVATDGGTPFAGARDPMQGLRRGLDTLSDEAVAAEVLRRPGVAKMVAEGVANGGTEAETEESAGEELPEPDTDPVADPVLRTFDVIKMGEHVLVVGDSEHGFTKLRMLKYAGLPYRRENYFPGAEDEEGTGDGEMNAVLVTDQPYGQDKERVTNDDRANWGTVYHRFQPRGGFIFCAFHPPLFGEAEQGIIDAGGEPKEYLALNKGGGRMWSQRLQNRIDGIIYFERAGEPPWIEGERAVSWLTPSRKRADMEERKEMAGNHTTPKYIDVLVKLISLVTRPGDVVLDPFAGSGTTLIACERHPDGRRRFLGSELEPEYAERAVLNWMKETGEDATVNRNNCPWPLSMKELLELPAPRAAELAHLRDIEARRAG